DPGPTYAARPPGAGTVADSNVEGVSRSKREAGCGATVTAEQASVFAILAGALGLFVWGRIRYDLVALLALLAAVAAGVVKPEEAFRGFSDDIVIIVGSALVVSAAVARSGIAEALIRPLAPYLKSSTAQVAVLTSSVALLSAFMKNIGALAIFI